MILATADRNDHSRIKGLYKSAFPAEERIPFFLLKRKARQGRAAMLAAKEENCFVGFIYLVDYRDLVYLFFFAVDPSMRGSGNGGEILRLLRERYPDKRIFLAREQLNPEADNYELRCRRREFYLRNGFTDLPCRIQEAGVVYDAMGIGGNISAREYEELITSWSGNRLRRLLGMRMVEQTQGGGWMER